ncbi:hypothetical protein RBB50_012442 [Rhinocladiella similis]
MPDNTTDPPQGAPKPPSTTNTPQAGGSGKPKKPPAQNGVKPSNNWGFVQTPEDVESSQDKK